MILGRTIALSLVISPGTLSTVNGLVQDPNLVLPSDVATHRAAVQKIFTTSYTAYKFVNRISPHPSIAFIADNLLLDMLTFLL